MGRLVQGLRERVAGVIGVIGVSGVIGPSRAPRTARMLNELRIHAPGRAALPRTMSTTRTMNAMRVMLQVLLALLAQSALLEQSAHARTVIYVNDDAPGPVQDGTSWGTAYRDLQAALNAAGLIPEATRDVEIWVAAGTYVPGSSELASFELVARTAVRGGFIGNETSLDQRPTNGPPSILSGDVLNDDDPGFGDRTDNTDTIVRAGVGLDERAVLDRFIIRGAEHPGGTGGGFAPSKTSLP